MVRNEGTGGEGGEVVVGGGGRVVEQGVGGRALMGGDLGTGAADTGEPL